VIETGIYSLITANAGFTAIADGRIYPLIMPDDLTASLPVTPPAVFPPAATYKAISSITQYTMGGSVGMVTTRMQFDCFASDYLDAKNIATAIRLVLENYTGTLTDGTFVNAIWVANVTDSYESDVRLYRTSIDFKIVYAQ